MSYYLRCAAISYMPLLPPQYHPTNKYRAKPITIDGHRFPSRQEGRRYEELKLLVRAGEIAELELQPKYPITINGVKICTVILDFRYRDVRMGKEIIEDVKGRDNALSRLKRKLVEAS